MYLHLQRIMLIMLIFLRGCFFPLDSALIWYRYINVLSLNCSIELLLDICLNLMNLMSKCASIFQLLAVFCLDQTSFLTCRYSIVSDVLKFVHSNLLSSIPFNKCKGSHAAYEPCGIDTLETPPQPTSYSPVQTDHKVLFSAILCHSALGSNQLLFFLFRSSFPLACNISDTAMLVKRLACGFLTICALNIY